MTGPSSKFIKWDVDINDKGDNYGRYTYSHKCDCGEYMLIPICKSDSSKGIYQVKAPFDVWFHDTEGFLDNEILLKGEKWQEWSKIGEVNKPKEGIDMAMNHFKDVLMHLHARSVWGNSKDMVIPQ